MMSNLCTGGFGRNILRSSKKGPKEVPQSSNNDEIYGFLPNHRWSNRSLISAPKSPALSVRSTRSLQPRDVSSKLEQTYQSLDTSAHSSGYGSQKSSPNNTFNTPNSVKNETGSYSSQSTVTSCRWYPRTLKEIHDLLEKSNKNVAANIPLLVSRDYKPPSHWTGKREVSVRRGTVVNALYKVLEWVYVKTADDREGYVPVKCLDVVKKKRTISSFNQQFPDESSNDNLNDTCTSGHGSMTSLASSSSINKSSRRQSKEHVTSSKKFLSKQELRVLKTMVPRQRSPFVSFLSNEMEVMISSNSTLSDDSVASSSFSRSKGPELTVLFDYIASQEGDISVRKSETVILLNDEDPDWLWVQTTEGREGFVPKSYVANLKALHLDPNVKTTYF